MVKLRAVLVCAIVLFFICLFYCSLIYAGVILIAGSSFNFKVPVGFSIIIASLWLFLASSDIDRTYGKIKKAVCEKQRKEEKKSLDSL